MLLEFFKSASFSDSQLGTLKRKGGLWRGAIQLGNDARVPLAISGPGSAPDATALEIAHQLPILFSSWTKEIQDALFEHYGLGADSAAGDPDAGANFPKLGTPEEAFSNASLRYVSVTPLGGELTVELGYAVPWDDDHMLGAQFRGGKFFELCGSVLQP